MEIRRKMINQRYMTVSPRGFNSNSVSPRGFNCLSVSPNGFNSFLIALMLMISLPIFSQTEGKYEVVISKGAKINFSNGFNVTKTQLYPGFRMYDITPVFPFFINNANNGLSISGSNVQLGGTLVQATNINQNGFNFSTNGVGNFGIGTSTPLQKLHVNGAVQFQNALMPNGNAGLAGQVLVSQGAATVPVWQTLSSGWGLLGNAGTVQSTNFLGTIDNVGLSFRTNNIIRQTIDNNGNVGIGTTTPIEELHIQKNQITPTRLLLDNIGPVSSTTTTSFALGEGNITHAEFRRFRDGSGKAEIGNIQNAPLNLFTTDLTRMTILGNGNVGIGTLSPTARFQVDNLTGAMSSVALFRNGNGSGGFAVRGESINVGAALGVYGELGVWDGTRWSGVRGNSGITTAPAVTGFSTVAGGVSAYFNERVGIGTITPTSTLHVIGSVAETVTVITATTSLNATHNKIVLNNGAANIVITLPDALTCIGRKYEFTRYAGSTGAVGIIPAAGQIQALAGTVGATTTLGLHSAAGAGLKHTFTAVNIGGVGVWVRL